MLGDAAAQGICRLSCNGCFEGDWDRVLQLVRGQPGHVVANFGLHPWWVGWAGTGFCTQQQAQTVAGVARTAAAGG